MSGAGLAAASAHAVISSVRLVSITALCAAVALVGCSSSSKPKNQDDARRTPDPDSEIAPRWEGADPNIVAKPVPARARLVEAHAGHGTPTATLPGFRMLANGHSRVFLEVSGDVPMVPLAAPGRLTYRFSGVRVPERVNRMPLPTGHFPTPVARVQLNQVGADAELVIELRAVVQPKVHVERTNGSMVISADFPRPEDVQASATGAASSPSSDSGQDG